MIELSSKNIVHPKSFNAGINSLRFLQIDFLARCNANCLNCIGSHDYGFQDWSFDKACEVLDATLGDLNFKEVWLSCQAEFTIYPYCIDIIDYIEDSYRMVIMHEDTNAISIPDGFIERLNSLENNFYDLSISFWAGNEEDYATYHRDSHWNDVISNTKKLLTELKNPNVILRFSIPHWSADQYTSALHKIDELMKETTGKEIRILNTTDFERDLTTYNTFDGSSVLVFGRNAFNTDENGKVVVTGNTGDKLDYLPYSGNCYLLNKTLIVRPNGTISPCLGTMDNLDISLGNVFDQKVTGEWLKSIYRSEERLREVKDNCLAKGAFPKCAKCAVRFSY